MAQIKYKAKRIPERDADVSNLLYAIAGLSAEQIARACKGKITAQTIRNWRSEGPKATRYPRHISMAIVLAAVGHRFVMLPRSIADRYDEPQMMHKETPEKVEFAQGKWLTPKQKAKLKVKSKAKTKRNPVKEDRASL